MKTALLKEVAALREHEGRAVHEKWVAAWAENAWTTATKKEPALERYSSKGERQRVWELRDLAGCIAFHLVLSVYV